MSCDVKFQKNLGLDCITEIISDVRSGNISVETAKKGLWAIGCGIEFIMPSPMMMGDASSNEKTMEELCAEIEGCLPRFGSSELDKDPVEINPIIVIALVQLVFNIIQFLRTKKV